MARKILRLTVDALDDLVGPCGTCAVWETGVGTGAMSDSEAASEKETWVSTVLREWGACGRLLYIDGTPVGHVLYAPARHVPGSERFLSGPVSDDAVLITSFRVREDLRRGGLGRVLVQAVVKDMMKRSGVRAIEAFGSPTGTGCTLPTDFLLHVGFKTLRDHPVAPLMRMEMRSVLSWRYELEQALEKIRGVVVPNPAPRPAADIRGQRTT